MSWKVRLYRSLPFVLVMLSAAGIVITDELWFAIVGVAGLWLIPSPMDTPANVSRETLREGVSRETLGEEISRIKGWLGTAEYKGDNPITAPCAVMHGSAEPHVLGCVGWYSDRE